MRSPRPLLALLLACSVWLAATASTALAAESPAVVDCNAHNALTRHYSVAQLRSALATMPADVREYTSCYQIIQDQLFRELGKPVPGASNGGGGSFLSVPVIVAIIVVVLAGGGFALAAYRRQPR